MQKLRIWILAARPKTLLASVSPVLLGTALSMADGFFNFLLFLATLFTALGIQICSNMANDYIDFIKGADVATRKGPLRVMQAKLVTASVMKKALVIAFGGTFCLGLYLVFFGGTYILILLCLGLALAYLYTGGPYPLAYLGIADIFAIIFFGPIAVASTYFLQSHSWGFDSFLIGIAPGALTVAILVCNNVRDIQEDVQASKRTLVVRFGLTFGKWEYASMIVLALMIPFFFINSHPLALLSLLTLFPAGILIYKVFTFSDPTSLNSLLAKTAQLLFLFCLLFSLGWML